MAGYVYRIHLLVLSTNDSQCKCVSDDLKREGVLPRTCISNRPIRRPENSPRNGPPGPMSSGGQRRNSPPNGNRGPPMNNGGRGSPAPGQGQFRPQQRGPGPMGPGGRPQGPGGPMRPMSPGMGGGNGRNSPGPNYRPQQGRPMSPSMGPMGPNGPRNNGPPRNGPGPMSGPPMTPTQGGPGLQQARRLTPPQGPPAALQAGVPMSDSVAHIAANFPLPGSPTTSIPPSSPTNVEFKTAIPEVIITASPSNGDMPTRGNSVVKKVTVGRKPLPGSAQ